MTKIIITPAFVNDYKTAKDPSILTITRTGIFFSKSAGILLALKDKSAFVLEYEDGKIYYADASHGFTVVSESGKHKLCKAYSSTLLEYLKDSYKSKDAKIFKYELGEFLEGRRELKLISTIA
ncbi:MAG: hypothetical protein ACOYOV_08995 [Bacteroidales bacterium]